MSNIINESTDIDLNPLVAKLGGILFTPSVFVNCLISSKSRSSLYASSVLNILGRSTDFLIKGYIIEIDKHIVQDNLDNAKSGGYITPEKVGMIEGALDSLTVLKRNPDVEAEANDRSNKLSLYDARRIETAFQHNLAILSSEPEHFTIDSDELYHIFQHEYADISIGDSIDVDKLESDLHAKVWVFKPAALDKLFSNARSEDFPDEVNRDKILDLIDFHVSSSMSGSEARVKLSMRGEILVGIAEQEGPIDAVLRSIEAALTEVIEIDSCDVHHRVSDTTKKQDSVVVSVRLSASGHHFRDTNYFINSFEAADIGKNTLLSTAKAYVKAWNTVLMEYDFDRGLKTGTRTTL